MSQLNVVSLLSLMLGVSLLQACTVFYSPEHGKHKKGGEHSHERVGVVIEIPSKKPEVKPMPN